MQAPQTSRPPSFPGPGPKGRIPGPPGRGPGAQSGARPGPPKPQIPGNIGNRPMVPIANLIQFTPFTASEEDSEKKETTGNEINVTEDKKKIETEATRETEEDVEEKRNIGEKAGNTEENVDKNGEEPTSSGLKNTISQVSEIM